MVLIKEMADSLGSYEDKNLSRRLYEVYASALKASGPEPEQLKKAGQDFVQQKNIYLAKTLFEGYLEQFTGDPDILARETVLIADKFAHRGRQEALDLFMPKVFIKKRSTCWSEGLFGHVAIQRAFNLERMKDFEAAMKEYGKILSDYPDFSDQAEVEFRIAVLRAYAVRDIHGAVASFEHIKTTYPSGRLALSSLYQLGLLSQWESQNDAAKAYYEALMTSASSQGADMEKDELVLLSRERLQEIEEKKSMKYALRLFFEGVFGASGDAQASGMPLNVDVMGRPAKAASTTTLFYTVTTSNPVTGCMMPPTAIEWSGETGARRQYPPNSANVEQRHITASRGIK
jgi:tetratricopeptide (TPR) repeat protein